MPRYAKKVDSTQAAIVEGLRKMGYDVYPVGQPVDLLVHWMRGSAHMLRTLECKSPTNKAGAPKLDKRSRQQADFCERTGTPYVVTLEQAVAALEAA